MTKTCIIISYFSKSKKFPKYFQYFLQTCRYNPDFDWMIFSNCQKPQGMPENVIFQEFSITDFQKLVAKKLKINVKLTSPYKLIDFKPTYGLIFEDYLKDYSFWAHSDPDILFGKIGDFITPDLLEKYDVISPVKNYVCGHFTLYKNNNKFNSIFKNAKNYEKILSEEKIYGFDEICSVDFTPFDEGKDITDLPKNPESMTHLLKRLNDAGMVKACFRDILGNINTNVKLQKNFLGTWENGRIRDKSGEELMYFHFQLPKNFNRFTVSDYIPGTTKFYISENGIFHPKERFSLKRYLKIFHYHLSERLPYIFHFNNGH